MKQANDELETVRRELETLRLREMHLGAERFQSELRPRIQQTIGRTFVWRNNSYGGDGKWDTFQKVVAVIFSEYHVQVIYQRCQIDCDGKPTLTLETDYLSSSTDSPHMRGSWTPCGLQEYDSAYNTVLMQLTNPIQLIEYLQNRDY